MIKDCSGRPWTVALVLLLAACSAEEKAQPVASRPVTVVTLERTAPERAGQVTGIAKPHREEGVGFEVAGRVELVIQVGREVRGPTIDEDLRIVERGELIARIDPTRYQQALVVAEKILEAGQKGLTAERIELEKSLPADLLQAEANAAAGGDDVKVAQANEKLANFELQRTQELFDQGNASGQDRDRRQAEYDAAAGQLSAAQNQVAGQAAAVARAEAQIALKGASIERTKAQIAQYDGQRAQAQEDLDDCTLYAPFSGRVTARHVGRGGYLRAGQMAVTLTMMDPIKVTAAVTPDHSRELLPGTAVEVMPKDLDRFTSKGILYGHVYDKPEVADSQTRTYLIDVVVRNLRRQPFVVAGGGEKVHAIDRMLPVLRREPGSDGPLFVPVTCVSRESGQDLVYRIPDVRFGEMMAVGGVFKPDKQSVTLEDELLTIVNWTFRRIADGSQLAEGDGLIVDPRPEHVEGVAIARHDWSIRPGDIVPMRFSIGASPEGFYVPSEAIRTLNGVPSVFVIDQRGKVQRVTVTVHETVGVLRRIEGPGLEAGARIVLDGVHYVADGESVRVVSELGK